MQVVFVQAPHPAALDLDVLLSECDLRFQRRSGPGGQHRNKTSSGVFLHHEPTDIVAEATERRSQADNRAVALDRLRYRLAIAIRSVSVLDGNRCDLEDELRGQYQNSPLRIGPRNEIKPAVLALLLNDLHAAGGQPSVVAAIWGCSTSAIVRLLKSHPPAFVLLNTIRRHHQRGPLK